MPENLKTGSYDLLAFFPKYNFFFHFRAFCAVLVIALCEGGYFIVFFLNPSPSLKAVIVFLNVEQTVKMGHARR